MKRYRITLEGHTFDVKVLGDPRRDRVQVEVDGETFTVGVEAAPAAPAREAAMPAAPTPTLGLGGVVPASSTASPSPSEAGEGIVSAPLPGVVKSIAVRTGHRVAVNDELLVIEAMKMANVIRAPREGTVGVIHVTEGRQVAYGEPLLEINDERRQP